jgi:hypothetical protein
MNYQSLYTILVEKRILYPATGQIEKHHIIPRCLGGSNEASNFVHLSLREHFLAHKLLTKIHPNNGSLLYAANMMSKYKKYHCRIYNGRKLTETHKQIISTTHKGKILSDETKNKIKSKRKTQVITAESNIKRSETLKGRTSPMKGKVSSMKGVPRSADVLQKAWETRRKNKELKAAITKV